MTGNYVVDMVELKGVLRELLDIAESMDGFATEVDYDRGRGRHNDADQAAMSRHLLRAASLCELASAEFGAVYWSFKGYRDPRFSE